MTTVDWLLEEDAPPIAYLARLRLLGESPTARRMTALRRCCNEYPPVARMLAGVDKAVASQAYQKYAGAYWTLIFLADMHADPGDARAQKLAAHVLSVQLPNGGFSPSSPSFEIVCLTANALRALVHFGYGDDERVRRGYERLAERIVSFGGVPCVILEYSLQSSCKMTLPQTLRCVAVAPPAVPARKMKELRDVLVKQMLGVRVYHYVRPDFTAYKAAVRARAKGVREKDVRNVWIEKHSFRNDELLPKQGWKRFGFPRSYNPDLLEAMLALAENGVAHQPVLDEALDWIESKRTKDGRWKLEESLNGKMLATIERRGQPSKWITLRALTVLKHFGRSAALGLSIAALCFGLSSCGSDDSPLADGGVTFQPTSPALLSTGSPTKDEDPCVMRARDGSMVVAWFSDRGGNSDIYLTRTTDGATWAPAVRVTTSPDGDFYPNLYQDKQGTFHLAWFRWYALDRGHIVYNHSTNPLVWDEGLEDSVTTTPDVDDWVPSITGTADSLLVFFVSNVRDAVNPTNEIYVAKRALAGTAWSAAVKVPGINSATEHDHLPFAARTGAGEITLVWVRHDTSQKDPWLQPPPTSHLFVATSPDGTTWSAPLQVTNEAGPVVNVFPALYRRQGGAWRIVWLSTGSGALVVSELPLANVAAYPSGLIANTALPDGYSHRIAATPTSGVYLGAWVQGSEGTQDIYYRFFRD